MVVQLEADTGNPFQIILKISKAATDTETLLRGIGEYWFSANNKSIFSQRSAIGPFTDLKAITKKSKIKKYGGAYPILVASGALRDSLTNPRNRNAIFDLNKERVVLGSRLPYVKYHMEGFTHRSGTYVSARPPISLSAGGLQTFIARIRKETGAYFYSKLRGIDTVRNRGWS